MIELKEVSKQFDGVPVVKGLNLSVREGEIVGLLGPNGAGKTTTLRMIAGVLPQSSGSVTIDGKTFLENEQELKPRIGYLPEGNPLYDELTVEEYLLFWAKIKGIPKDNMRESLEFIVKNTGLAEVYYRPIGELSKGFRQRVGLSQAILTRPQILIFDEPTEGLDPNQRHDIAELITTLGKKRTVVISSHVLSEIAKICNRLVIIHRGMLVADDTADNLRRGRGKAQIIEAEIKGEGVLAGLKTVEGVSSVAKFDERWYKVEATKGDDVREKIFKKAVAKKWVILTMTQKVRELEDVFSQLTSG